MVEVGDKLNLDAKSSGKTIGSTDVLTSHSALLELSDSSSDDSDMPSLEANDYIPSAPADGSPSVEEPLAIDEELLNQSRQNRGEKKARKALVAAKLGLKPVTGIKRVTFTCGSKSSLFVIAKPEVFKSPTSETYVVFGEAKMEDMNTKAQMAAVEKFRNFSTPTLTPTVPDEQPNIEPLAPSRIEEVDENGEEVKLDSTGLDEHDINLVMGQTGGTRNQAINALRQHEGDIVNAIVALTM